MRVRFLRDFEARTATGSRIIEAGEVREIGEEKAARLIAAGIAEELGQTLEELTGRPFIVWRTADGRRVFLVETDPERRLLQRPGEAWFSGPELAALKGVTGPALNMVIDAKEVFPEAGTFTRNATTPPQHERGTP